MAHACPPVTFTVVPLAVALEPDPSAPPSPDRFAGPVRLKDLRARIESVIEAHETLATFTRLSVRNEILRRQAVVAEELRRLDRADWRSLLGSGVSL